MTKVSISGSRSLKQIPQKAIDIGDCYGIDSLVQKYLKSRNYGQVKVDHMGKSPRHNYGFETVKVTG